MNTPTPAPTDVWLHVSGMVAPWRVTERRIDTAAKIVHLWITRHPKPEATPKKRHWFGLFGGQGTPHPVVNEHPKGPDLQWRHINCMDYACVIHTTDVLEERHHDLPWLGQMGVPFTNRMAKQIVMCVAKGMELSTVAELFDVTYADLWKFKFGMDQAPAHAQAAANPQLSAAAQTLPDPSHPVWEQLMAGDIHIEIKTLGFQLLLSKLRQQIHLQPTPEVKSLKLRELHRYMVRHAHSLNHELQQLQQHLAKHQEPA